jgi:hypothetical protein
MSALASVPSLWRAFDPKKREASTFLVIRMLTAVLEGRISHWHFVALKMLFKCESENSHGFTPLVFLIVISFVFDVVTTRLG